MFEGALFDEYKNFAFKFPEPQYLGAKAGLLPWIAQFLPDNVDTALDAFAGSQSVGYYFKQLGCKTIVNDFLSFNNQIGKALIELGAAGHDDILSELRGLRKEVIQEAQQDKKALMQWLYEKQGEMRFGTENRLFVILVDSSDMTQSWKMKRAFEQIEPAVKNYLDRFDKTSLSQIDFTFNDKKYSSLADVIFVVK